MNLKDIAWVGEDFELLFTIPEEKVDIWLQGWGTKNEEQAPEL